MYNTDLPRRADLPTSAQLWRSTIIAAVAACGILVTLVLPSEYAIDPTGVGGYLGLTQMGKIKAQLAAEAAADAASSRSAPATAPRDQAASRRSDQIEAFLSTPSSNNPVQPAPEPKLVAPAKPAMPSAGSKTLPRLSTAGRVDEISFTLVPGQGAEVKLVMRQGAQANFTWSSAGGVVNFDTHGDAPGQSASYEKGRGVDGDDGVLEAAFDGNHGWFWRNRGSAAVTITLRTSGDYTEFKRVL